MANVPALVTGRVRGVFAEIGELFIIAMEALRRTWDVRHWFWEFVEQCWFLARVTTMPVILIAIPLGATVALQVGDLAGQLGAKSATGGAVVVGLVREVAPIAAALVIAGAGGWGPDGSATSSPPWRRWP
jgi:phospholipid/cholesterol/gamma-HCH transport system permease protein